MDATGGFLPVIRQSPCYWFQLQGDFLCLLFVQKAILGPENLDFLKCTRFFVYIFGHKTPLASLIFTKKGSVLEGLGRFPTSNFNRRAAERRVGENTERVPLSYACYETFSFVLYNTAGRELPMGRTIQIWEIFCVPFGNVLLFAVFSYIISKAGCIRYRFRRFREKGLDKQCFLHTLTTDRQTDRISLSFCATQNSILPC